MRNADYQFVSTDTDAVLASMIGVYETITERSLLPADPDMLFIRWVADVVIKLRNIINYTGNQNIPGRAEGINLDALAQLFYDIERPAAKAASCTIRFYISSPKDTLIVIPSATRVTGTGGGLVWETVNDSFVPIGQVFADVPVRCLTEGIVGNGFELGQINTLVDISNINYFLRCENITVSGGGADVASDDEFYDLLRLRMDAYSTAGPAGGYIYYAKSVSTEIVDVVANSPSPGVVAIYALMEDGTPAGEVIKNSILDACNASDARPLADFVTVCDPDKVLYDIDVVYYLPNNSQKSLLQLEAAVEDAVNAFIKWQCSKLGRDINPDELRLRLKDAGVKRIVLNNPDFKALRDGRTDGSVPEIAVIGNIKIINGGYENE